MKRRGFFIIGTLCVVLAISFYALASHPSPANFLNFAVGDNVFPYLRIWGGVDQVNARLYVSTNTGLTHNAYFYGQATNTYQQGMAAAAYTNNSQAANGATLYGEADTLATSQGGAWGANLVGNTYNAAVPAHGVEVNGINSSTGNPVVDGVFVVNYGTRKTLAGVAVATSIEQPASKPDYGIILAGPNSFYSNQNVAAVTGLYIDSVDSQEAIRIQDNHRIALAKNGNTYIRYNSTTNRVQIVKNGVVVAQW
jgi:hypothetical protein